MRNAFCEKANNILLQGSLPEHRDLQAPQICHFTFNRPLTVLTDTACVNLTVLNIHRQRYFSRLSRSRFAVRLVLIDTPTLEFVLKHYFGSAGHFGHLSICATCSCGI